jgi:hypothetical protein
VLGAELGTLVGDPLATCVGNPEKALLVAALGTELGSNDGPWNGAVLGAELGSMLGTVVGKPLATCVGAWEKVSKLGMALGPADGTLN